MVLGPTERAFQCTGADRPARANCGDRRGEPPAFEPGSAGPDQSSCFRLYSALSWNRPSLPRATPCSGCSVGKAPWNWWHRFSVWHASWPGLRCGGWDEHDHAAWCWRAFSQIWHNSRLSFFHSPTVHFLSIAVNGFVLRLGAVALLLGFAIWATIGPPQQSTARFNIVHAH